MEASWLQLMTAFMFVYLISNVMFACVYLLVPNSINHPTDYTFAEAFFFSVQTMSTIGYGELHPQGLFSNTIVTIEAAFGLIGVAVITGIVFAKLSKPSAKVLFSKPLLDTKIDGQRVLTFRIGNARGNDIVDARLQLSGLIDHTSVEGDHTRKIISLKLVRERTAFFKLSWTATHIIDEHSPLYDLDLTSEDKLIVVIATVTGHDSTYSNTIYSRHVYMPEDIIKDRYFEDIIHETHDGRLMIDYDKFHDLKRT